MQATQTLDAVPIPIAQPIRGQVSDATSRYAVDLEWNGASLQGRLGGWWFAEKIRLERSPRGLIGYVSSRSVHLTVHVAYTAEARLELLIGGHGQTQTIELGLSDDPKGYWRDHRGEVTPIDCERTDDGYVISVADRRVSLRADLTPDWVAISAGLVSLAAQRAVSSAMLESLGELREL